MEQIEEDNEEEITSSPILRQGSTTSNSTISKTIRSSSFPRHSFFDETRLSKFSFLKGAKPDSFLSPFYLRWSFGISLDVCVKNLSNKDRTLLFYAASHSSVLYDYVSREMRFLQGHKNLISDIASDDTGKWLVTADKGDDSCIIVWDSTECLPVNTIFNPHPYYGIALVALSGNAKYLISLGKEYKPVMNFWCWTYGNEKPDASEIFKASYGLPVKIRFNPNVQEHIMVAFEKQVLFFTWDDVNGKILSHTICDIKNRKGVITDCTYIDDCHECVACTSEGCMLVFGNAVYVTFSNESELHNNKIYAKTVKVGSVRINCIESADGMLATGDVKGHIKFYDKRLKILYWCQNFSLPPVTSISFDLHPRKYKIKDPCEFDEDDNFDEFMNEEYEDKTDEYECLYAQLVPSDATIHRLPFVVRDFFIATADGRIVMIDYMRNRCNFLFRKADAAVTAIEIHDEENYLCIGYANGNICLYNYISREIVVYKTLPEKEQYSTIVVNPITAIKYSPECLHLACGRDDGSLWFLDPIYLTPKHPEPLHLSQGGILKMAFSIDSRYFCFFDTNSTVVLMKFSTEDEEWYILGKLRSHYKPIRDILFTPYLPSRLFSIGEDRILFEYDLEQSGDGMLLVLNKERFEQTAIPITFIYYPKSDISSDRYFFTADNQYKYKKIHDVTNMCHSVTLGPAYGCYDGSPVSKIMILPQHENKYLIFANNNYIGVQLLPADGNPFRFVGTIGHPIKLLDFCVCREGKYIFTIGADDSCVLMWRINVLAPQTMEKIGGIELYPFYCLIEGGLKGWLFKEMQDLFYYMQILHQGENTVLPRVVSDMIPVSELPDLMRACGFYPTEYEIENMVIEVKYNDFDETKTLKEEVSFLDFVKLYVNHRPAHGISLDLLRESFNTYCLASEGPRRDVIDSEGFVTLICEKGEIFSPINAYKCLATLMHTQEKDDGNKSVQDFSFLPSEFDFDEFLEDVLGMELDRQTMEDSDKPADVKDLEQLC